MFNPRSDWWLSRVESLDKSSRVRVLALDRFNLTAETALSLCLRIISWKRIGDRLEFDGLIVDRLLSLLGNHLAGCVLYRFRSLFGYHFASRVRNVFCSLFGHHSASRVGNSFCSLLGSGPGDRMTGSRFVVMVFLLLRFFYVTYYRVGDYFRMRFVFWNVHCVVYDFFMRFTHWAVHCVVYDFFMCFMHWDVYQVIDDPRFREINRFHSVRHGHGDTRLGIAGWNNYFASLRYLDSLPLRERKAVPA